MTQAAEVYYGLSSKGRLETLARAITEGLDRGEDAKVLEDWFEEAKAESARWAGVQAQQTGRETVVIDGMEVPSGYSALVRQIKNVQVPWIHEIAGLFDSEADFHQAMEMAQKGEKLDPRLTQLSFQLVEWRPRLGMHGLHEGSVLPAEQP